MEDAVGGGEKLKEKERDKGGGTGRERGGEEAKVYDDTYDE
ncbi:hypothetical protein L195_g059167, partial [Trifolium pratense]